MGVPWSRPCADYSERVGADWPCLRDWLLHAAVHMASRLELHTSEVMTTARGLYERMGFTVNGDLPMNFGLLYWRFRRDI